MDRDRAKFVLESFRADGSDGNDRDFAEALDLATQDKELGEWLIRERAFDAGFAEALARVQLPDGLRAQVLLAMVQAEPRLQKMEVEFDEVMVSALGSLKIPKELRGRIIEGMERSAAGQAVREAKVFDLWFKYGIPLAAAAGISFAFIQIGEREKGDGGEIADTSGQAPANGELTLAMVQSNFVNDYDSQVFRLEQKDDDAIKLVNHLREKGLPCGDMKFPPGLKNLKGMGCCEMVVNNKRGSVICFSEQEGAVHLVIFKRCDIDDELPGLEHPNIEVEGKWAKASWGNDRYVYTLLSDSDRGDLGRFF